MTDLPTLIRPFELKATSDATRTFSGLAAAYALDQGGDMIAPGAFKRTLKDWKSSKHQRIIPLIDSHQHGSVRAVVGKMTAAEETAAGLSTTFLLVDGPDGDEVYRRIKGGFVNGLSIGYEVVAARTPTPTEAAAWPGTERVLTELKLREISVVIWPMNQAARADAATAKRAAEARAMAAYLAALDDGSGDLAPDAPRRLAMEDRYRRLVLAGLTQEGKC